jgi:PAS domain S-box-containing protein
MPFETAGRSTAEPENDGPHVERFEQETRDGTVYYYRGIAPILHIRGRRRGRVEITIPYFFENPKLLARTGPMTPEILQNVERGALAPRVDEPEDLLVAKVRGGKVVDSSNPLLAVGTEFAGTGEEWFDLDIGRDTYRTLVMVLDDGGGFLVGYRLAGIMENLLKWATIVSLDVLLTLLSFVVIMILKRLPVVGRTVPSIQFAVGLGFREKILLSFIAVSILPVVILGLFSTQFIQRRFKLEGEQEALAGADAAASLIVHSIRSEAASFAGSQYLRDIIRGRTDAQIRDVAMLETTQFTLFDRMGEILLDESLSDFNRDETGLILDNRVIGKLSVSFSPPYLYGGVVLHVNLPGHPGGYLYYRRRIDDGFVGDIASTLGKDINVYYGGRIIASSERELFIGGFLDKLVAPSVFAGIALRGSEVLVRQEALGDYTYQVASAPLTALRREEHGVLSVPMLYQPALIQKELLRTSALVLGLLALLLAATITLGFFLAGKIFNPIAALIGGIRRIIEGDLSFRLEAEAPDEIGELVASFNTMTAALGEAQRNLLERQRYLTAVLDNVATGVMASDSDGRIITLNPAGERILGLSVNEVVGRRTGEIGGEELEPLFRLFAMEGARGSGEHEFSLFSGSEKREIKAVVAGIDVGGERLGTVVVFDDLTELIKSKKLSAWIEMARQIAHEVKNPLTPLRLSAQLMQRAYDAKSEQFGEIFKSGVETVLQQADILRRIASEFSSFGKVSDLKPETVRLGRFLEEFISSYRGAERVDIEFRGEDDIPVRADREGLRKVLVNLVENALEAMPGGGKITLDCYRSGEEAVISVADTGTGLPADVQERLFEPYFSTKTNGTGLGLAICRNLMHEMDGEIVLRNREVGLGVEAIVRLPVSNEGDGS